MIDPSALIIVGILIIGFGFWYKLYIAWYPNTKMLSERIQKKLAQNQVLTRGEKFSLFNINSGLWMWRICFKLGVAVIAIGLILLITQQ